MSITSASIFLAVVFTCVGVFAIVAALASWDWFFNSPNVRILTGRLSRPKARVVYFVIGLAILLMAGYFVYKVWLLN